MWHQRFLRGFSYLNGKELARINTSRANLVPMSTSTSISLLEEEKVPGYDPSSYYSARVGQTLHRKYRLVSKLGWGSVSTVWLARVESR